MRKVVWIPLLVAILLTSLSVASLADQGPFSTLGSGISLFIAKDAETGHEIWRSNGTSAGTYRLTDDACTEYCESYNSTFSPWIRAGNRAFAFVQDNESSTLWVTDGSRAGTVPVYEGTKIWNLDLPIWVKSLDLLFFIVHDNSTPLDYELWCSDGTPEGTHKVKTFVGADTRSAIRSLTAFQGRAFFNGYDSVHGPALWASDGTEAGTVLVRDFFRDEEGNDPSSLRVVGSRLLFIAPSPSSGTVLWASDGTPAGTRQLRALQTGQNNYNFVYDARVVEGKLFLATGQQLWVSNGTPAGTLRAGTFLNQPDLSSLSLFKGRYYFVARTETFGEEIWSTTGTPAGTTRMPADLCPHSCDGASRGNLRVMGNRLLFTGNDGSRGAELWQSNGTAQGTRMVRDISPGFDGSSPSRTYVVGGRVLFAASMTLQGRQLWRTDGTKEGTIPLTNLDAMSGVVDELIEEIPGALLFRVQRGNGDDELWVSNGTRAGTRRLKTFLPVE
jgi:ELWxxDGT repeat protein